MDASRPRLAHGIMLILGLVIGLALATQRPTQLQAGGSDRSGESVAHVGSGRDRL